MSSLPLLRPLKTPEIVDRAIRLYRTHFALLVSIPLLAYLPLMFLQAATQMIWHTTQLIELIQGGLLQILVSSALITAISQSYLTHPPTTGDSYKIAGRWFGTAWGASLLIGLGASLPIIAVSCGAITLGMGSGAWILLLLALPVTIYLSTRWSLAIACILLEQLGVSAGLSRSWALTEGVFGKVFGTSILANLLVIFVATLPQQVVKYGLEALAPNSIFVPLVEIMLTQLGIILTTPVSIGVTVVLYYDLRVQKEGFDLEKQIQEAAV